MKHDRDPKLIDFKQKYSWLSPDEALASARRLLARTVSAPDSVDHSLEEYEALVRRLEQVVDQSDIRYENPLVSKLLRSPSSVLNNIESLPSADDVALSEVLARDAYLEWFKQRAAEKGGRWSHALSRRSWLGPPRPSDSESIALQWITNHARWPFPVGNECQEVGVDMPASAARDLMPFKGEKYAVLVSEGSPTLFFLGQQKDVLITDGNEWITDRNYWVVDGNVRVLPERKGFDKELVTNARIWWKSCSGLPIGPGRPRGRTDRTPKDFIDKLVEYKTQHGDRPPRLGDFLTHLGIAEGSQKTTWSRMSGDWGMTWSRIRKLVYGEAKPKREFVDHGRR